jgi:hypothetical protein
MPAIDAQTLINEVACYNCTEATMTQLLKVALERRILLVKVPTASVDLQSLVNYAACYCLNGLPQIDLVELALLDQISQA